MMKGLKSITKEKPVEEIKSEDLSWRKMSIMEKHLNVFGCRNEISGDFFIYVFTNMKGSTNR